MPRIQLEGWLCYRCNHKWVPRDDETPRVCPKCKSPYWDKLRKRDLAKQEVDPVKEGLKKSLKSWKGKGSKKK